jgi:hypothetical protein
VGFFRLSSRCYDWRTVPLLLIAADPGKLVIVYTRPDHELLASVTCRLTFCKALLALASGITKPAGQPIKTLLQPLDASIK